LQKIEVWRHLSEKPARYMDDDFIVAVATDSPEALPQATQRPVLNLNSADEVADWLQASGDRFDYRPEIYQ
jgi:molybdopterin-guanine dinucleotide biosynthesis protein B